MTDARDLTKTRDLEMARRAALFSTDVGCPSFEDVRGVAGRIAIAPLSGDRLVLAVRGAVQVLTGDDACAVAALLLGALDEKQVLVVADAGARATLAAS